ncbi:hypothetical protein [Corynebacterium liangguodongii]|uniref:Uncharacterized protein n=1 Tax=Corynebacterium liangguodongii TaxID=2079535 RepID=A0A2S0WGL8_9CORY|nr:hypothetical protein [Corynebacterium liangguodongii]AWB84822.1 hypothetical protein C3E79_10320 [Corynebacterium liangguodongii]PWB99179.1 hypothetical protein DF219_07935 [Corynebacterium liangguodongii]
MQATPHDYATSLCRTISALNACHAANWAAGIRDCQNQITTIEDMMRRDGITLDSDLHDLAYSGDISQFASA